MSRRLEPRFRRDALRAGLLTLAILSAFGVFYLTPGLAVPGLVSGTLVLLLAPLVNVLERRGMERGPAIGMILGVLSLVTLLVVYRMGYTLINQWNTFSETAPQYFQGILARFRGYEAELPLRYPILKGLMPAVAPMHGWAERSTGWVIERGPGMVGAVGTTLLIAPLLTFVLLKDGPAIRKWMFQLVPNRFFEPTVILVTRVTAAFSDYLRAKLIEASMVAVLVSVGLLIVKAPYAIALGLIAGALNIIPYLGPLIGAIPGLLITGFDPAYSAWFWPVAGVYLVANLVDAVLIFPVVVAKLVNLHPLALMIAVLLGQQYYGLIGMLISIPVATGLKIVVEEIFAAAAYRGLNPRLTPDSELF